MKTKIFKNFFFKRGNFNTNKTKTHVLELGPTVSLANTSFPTTDKEEVEILQETLIYKARKNH